MIADSINRPVRSSPLLATHSRLHAHWRAPDVQWPLDYGNPSAEAAAARSAAALVDWGPFDKLNVQGSGMAGALSRAGVEFAPGKVTHASVSGTKLQVWGVAPDEAILLYPPTVKLPDFTNSSGVATVNVSSALSVLNLVGPNSRGVLGELCPVDLRPKAVADLQTVHAPVANVRVTLARQDMGQAPAFTILVPRDYAAYLWEAMLHTGAPFGLVPAGNHVMEGI